MHFLEWMVVCHGEEDIDDIKNNTIKETLLHQCCREMKIPYNEFISNKLSQKPEYAQVRHMFYSILRNKLDSGNNKKLTYRTIGNYFNQKQSNVTLSIKNISNLCDTDPFIKNVYDKLMITGNINNPI